ncbi:MAG: alpha/beta hydrolase family protein [Bacteroidia bacterium]
MNKPLILLLLICFSITAQAQKKPIGIDDFNKWKRIENTRISTNGNYVMYKLSPEVGNKTLVINSVSNDKTDTLKRVSAANFAFNGNYAIATVVTDYEAIRQLKLKKEKKENYPKDSLYLVDLKTFDHQFIDLVKSWKTPETNGEWLAYLREEPLPEPEPDTTSTDSTEIEPEKKEDFPAGSSSASAKKDKDAKTLVIYNLKTKESFEYVKVKSFGFSENGAVCYFYSLGDSAFTKGAYYFNSSTKKETRIEVEHKDIKGLTADSAGLQLAFIFTNNGNKAKSKFYSLAHFNLNKKALNITDAKSLKLEFKISADYNPKFTDNGERLFFGVKPKQKEYPEDTLLLAEEKAKLDIWSHMDGRLQPQQLKEIKKDEKRSITYFLDIKKNSITQVGEHIFSSDNVAQQKEGRYALISDSRPYFKERSWESPWARDVYLKDLKKGTKELVFKKFKGSVSFSPGGNYLYWFNMEEGYWWLMNLKSGKKTNLTLENKNNYINLDDDHPMLKGSYGIGGWYEDDQFIFINTKNGFTAFDPTGKRKATEFGQKGNSRERIKRKDREPFISSDNGFFIEVFDTKTKEKSLYTSIYIASTNDFMISDLQNPSISGGDYYNFYNYSKNGDLSLWRIESNQKYPDLYISTKDGFKQLSNANPQQSKFKWYKTQLIDYLSADGDSLQGILYMPENFDANKKYPMIVYFYERMSDYINSYQTPRASYSTVSRSFYCSNDYFVFVPDIAYSDGEPGQSALNCIVPGVLNVLQKHPYINPHKMALQGQSWGGYQTAHLITRCDLFTCAMAGAPVSNMTSAYGGIRWGSGYNRAFQYEHGQSRIGGDLWNKHLNYIDNSPLFYADRVNTPLLIMHNDNDGAVPWYQGIEYFTALRRLEKEVWMLVYNKEEHNLTKRPNRVDLSHRMFGFFNYYLKGDEKPLWMQQGIPATDKGKYNGY